MNHFNTHRASHKEATFAWQIIEKTAQVQLSDMASRKVVRDNEFDSPNFEKQAEVKNQTKQQRVFEF